MPKSSSIAATSWLGPLERAASILFAPPARAFGTNRSRGIERMDTVGTLGSRWRIMTTSLFTPVTPCEQSP